MAGVARLIEMIVPEHYRLSLDVDMAGFRFKAEEEVRFELKSAAKTLVLHAVELGISLAELEYGAMASSIRMSADDQTVTLGFDEVVPAGKHTLSLVFSGSISESLHGFYRSRYEQGGQERWLATTQLEAVHAREALVCIDEPAAKAVFDVSLTVPQGLTALSNTNVASEELAGEGRKRVTFAPTPKMSTYLLAFMVGDFEYVEATAARGTAVRVYATPGQKEQLAFALETAVRSLDFYEDYFAIPYPLPKLDMIAVPDFSAGAMENWGLVTYRETALLLDPAKTSFSHKQRVAEVITHELAHQWFGNLVTMAWWDDLWLNEGFASWMEVFAKDALFPDWQEWTQFVSSDMAYSMELDGLANTHPIQVEVDDPRSLDEIFDAVSYCKGSSIINMLHHFLGAAAFRAGLQDYLKAHSYGNAVTSDLWQALGKASGKPVNDMMSAWTTQPGYPVVRFDEGLLTQERFYSSPRQAAQVQDGQGDRWPLPFGALLAGGRETKPKLVAKASADLDHEIVGSDWFKPNAGQTGFYRNHYTQGMVDALATPMQAGELTPVDRFGVVNDVMATTEAGMTDSGMALRLIQALRQESNYVVWGAIAGGFGSLTAVVEDDDLRDAFDRFGHWLVEPNLQRLGWEPKTGESGFDRLMRPVVLQQAIRYDDPAATAEARRRFEAYMSGTDGDPDLRPAILYAAARHGGEAEFTAMLGRYRTESSPQVKMGLLGAMGRFRKRSVIEQYLALGLSSDVRPQDLYIVLAWGAMNRYGRDLTWSWMKDNWELFLKRYGAGGHMLERFPAYIADGFATHKMAAEIGDFFGSHPHPATKRPTAQAVETVELKADWYERDQAKMRSFIEQWSHRQQRGPQGV